MPDETVRRAVHLAIFFALKRALGSVIAVFAEPQSIVRSKAMSSQDWAAIINQGLTTSDTLTQIFVGKGNFVEHERLTRASFMEATMNGLIYLVGLVVVVLAVLSFFGLR